MSQHTKAPWHLGATMVGPVATLNAIVGDDADPVHQLCDQDMVAIVPVTKPEQKANYRLILNAPALLAILKESTESIGGDWRAMRDALLQLIDDSKQH